MDGLLCPPQPNLPLPTIVLERGTVVVRIATPTSGDSVWEIAGARAALTEEQLGLAKFECRGESSRIGPLALQGTWKRSRGEMDMSLDMPIVPINLELLHELNRFAPMPLESIQRCSGLAKVHLDAHRRPDASPSWQPEWRVNLTKGRVGVREFPLDLEAIELDAKLADGKLMVSNANAIAGGATVQGKLVARLPATNPTEVVETAQLSVDHLLVTPELFARLPERAQKFHQRFSPVGYMSLDCQFGKRPTGGWDARVELRPDNIAGRYQKFPYPVRQVRGTVVTEFASDHPARHTVDVTCEVNGGDRFSLSGVVSGDEPHAAIDLRITSANPTKPAEIEIDEDLLAAFPTKFQPLARSFHCRGRCSLTGRIHRPAGQPNGHDQYHVRFRDCSVCYDAFALPLEHANGDLELHLGPGLPDDPNRGDHWLLYNATASHGSGQLLIAAHDEPVATGKRLVIEIGGEHVPLAEPLAKALTRYRLRHVWDLLSPSGVFDFTSRVTLTDQPGGPPRSEITLGMVGATVKPTFFPYALTNLSAHVHTAGDQVLLGECNARHGQMTLRFSGGEVRTQGGLWIDLRNIRATTLTPEQDFVRALPASLQRACGSLKPQGTYNVDIQRLVYFDPPAFPGPPGPPILQWDGSLALADASMATGVGWTDLNGVIACRGVVRGNRLESLNGHAALETTAILHQPLSQIHAQLTVDPETPDVLQVRRLSGKLFGGNLTGEARVVFGSGLDYALDVKLLGAQLQEFGKVNHIGEGQLAGTTTAQLYLSGAARVWMSFLAGAKSMCPRAHLRPSVAPGIAPRGRVACARWRGIRRSSRNIQDSRQTIARRTARPARHGRQPWRPGQTRPQW